MTIDSQWRKWNLAGGGGGGGEGSDLKGFSKNV